MGRYFGTDGIRGKANETLALSTAYKVGRFVGSYYDAEDKAKVFIGKDTRLSSSMYESMLAAGLSASGADVYLVGYCSTPCLAYLTMVHKFSCGVMISASHNPYYDNGIKIFGNDGLKIGEDVEGLIEDYIDKPEGIPYCTNSAIGKIIEYKQGIAEYQKWLREIYPLDLLGMKICVDLANGSNCYTAKEVLGSMNLDVTYINDSPDGTNINRDCGSTHLKMLKDTVKNGSYDLGFAFDGDADRVLFVDENGDNVEGDQLMYLLSKHLKNHGMLANNTLVTTVMSNIGLYKALDNCGISYAVTPVGDKNVVDCMVDNGFCIGGEQSGHIICSHDAYFGDGLKTALMVLSALSEQNCSLKDAVKELHIYPQLLVNVKVKDKTIVLNDDEINVRIDEIGKQLEGNGRILVRPSGTEPLIRVMVEAENDDICRKHVYEVIDLIKEKGYAA